jgi:hypothetical protein
MAFNATFKNILALSWRSVLLMEKTKAPGVNHRPAANHRQIVSRYYSYRQVRVENNNCSIQN